MGTVPIELMTQEALNGCVRLLISRSKFRGYGAGAVLHDWCIENGIKKLAPVAWMHPWDTQPAEIHYWIVADAYDSFCEATNPYAKYRNESEKLVFYKTHIAIRDWLHIPVQPFADKCAELIPLCGTTSAMWLTQCRSMLHVVENHCAATYALRMAWHTDSTIKMAHRHRLLVAIGPDRLPPLTECILYRDRLRSVGTARSAAQTL